MTKKNLRTLCLIATIGPILIANFHFVNFYTKLILFTIPIIIAFLLSIKYFGHFKKLTIFAIVVFGYLLACLISVFHSINPSYSFANFVIYLSLVLIAYHLVHLCKDQTEYIYLIRTAALMIFCVVIISLIFIAHPSSWISLNDVNRFQGVYIHPVSYATMLTLSLIILFGYNNYNKSNSFWGNVLMYLILIIQIILTLSRSPIIALIATIIIIATAHAHLRKKIKIKTLLLFSILIGIIFFGSTMIIEYIIRGQHDTFWQLTGRVRMWAEAFAVFQNNPLYGNGFGMAGVHLIDSGMYRSPDIIDNPVFGIGGVTHLHNAWFQATLQTNILGSICFSIMIILVIKKIVTIIKYSTKNISNNFIIPISGSLLFLLLISMVTSMPAMGRDIIVFIFFFEGFAADKFISPYISLKN